MFGALAVAYVLQVLLALWYLAMPLSKGVDHVDLTYTAYQGYPGGSNFIPLIGLLPMWFEPITVVIERDGVEVGRHHPDLIDDVQHEYPQAAWSMR